MENVINEVIDFFAPWGINPTNGQIIETLENWIENLESTTGAEAFEEMKDFLIFDEFTQETHDKQAREQIAQYKKTIVFLKRKENGVC